MPQNPLPLLPAYQSGYELQGLAPTEPLPLAGGGALATEQGISAPSSICKTPGWIT